MGNEEQVEKDSWLKSITSLSRVCSSRVRHRLEKKLTDLPLALSAEPEFVCFRWRSI